MCVLTAYGVQCLGCWLSEVRCRVADYASGLRDVAPSRKCPKHVEHFISAINHSVASSWFFLLYAYATMHGQTHIKYIK